MLLYTVQLSYNNYIPTYLVKEYEWCPLIPWIIANSVYDPPTTPSMEKGIETHRDQNSLEEVAKTLELGDYILEILLVSRKHRVVGLVDILSRKAKLLVDVKYTEKKPPRSHIAQLETYTLLAWHNNIPVYKALIVNHKTEILYSLEVDNYTLERARKRVEKTWKIIQSPDPPLVQQPQEKCNYCRYRTRCPNNP